MCSTFSGLPVVLPIELSFLVEVRILAAKMGGWEVENKQNPKQNQTNQTKNKQTNPQKT